ncbi:MAG: NAD(P)-dependent alcohol dehydrogenase [Notoacmeibacter sp.]|nr:NAD(P)-dependent alcohol dehydrogenase [Notoacmeibacter sp.]
MKAAVYDKYGPAEVVEIRDVARPEIGDRQVLVQTFATSVTTADWRIRASAFPGAMWLPGRLMFGLLRPRNRVLGMEFAGRVVSVGEKVTRFRMGEAVFGFASSGAHAEYLAMAADGAIAAKPASLGHDEAAAVPFGALSALVFLRDIAKVRPGQKVLVLGASGGVGAYAVQLARHFGASVTGVTSTDNVDLVRSLGAERVVDYKKEDYLADEGPYDLILDTAGISTFRHAKRALNAKGVFLPIEFGPREIMQALFTSCRRGKRVVVGISNDTREDLAIVGDLLERGEIRPVIDSTYPLERIADAYRRVESRHKTGSVVVTVGSATSASSSAA